MTASTRVGAAVIGGNIGYGTYDDYCGSITINDWNPEFDFNGSRGTWL